MKVYNGQKIHDLLCLIQLRDFWLTKKSIFALQDLINGFMIFGLYGNDNYTHKLIYYENDVDFSEFLYWIQEIPFLEFSNGPSFANFLYEKANKDEAKAFDLFYELLDEFKKLKIKKPDRADMP